MKKHTLITVSAAIAIFAALLMLLVAAPLPASVSFEPSRISNGVLERRVTRDLQFLGPAEWGFGTRHDAGLGTMNSERQPNGTIRFVPVTVAGYRSRWGILALDVSETYIDRSSP